MYSHVYNFCYRRPVRWSTRHARGGAGNVDLTIAPKKKYASNARTQSDCLNVPVCISAALQHTRNAQWPAQSCQHFVTSSSYKHTATNHKRSPEHNEFVVQFTVTVRTILLHYSQQQSAQFCCNYSQLQSAQVCCTIRSNSPHKSLALFAVTAQVCCTIRSNSQHKSAALFAGKVRTSLLHYSQ